ncbi:MAG: sensor histidine kinase [Bacteroidetes bacterium]|nr:sensor histidine kinase [Bacteroidota bacterium]
MNFSKNNLIILLFSVLLSTFLVALIYAFNVTERQDLVLAAILSAVTLFFGIKLFQSLITDKKTRRLTEIIRRYRNKNYSKKVDHNDVFNILETELHEWGKERREEEDRLNRLETHRREYIGNVSHELKTPVFNIEGYIHTLLDGGLEDKNINRDYLQRAGKNVERITHILRDLETVSQLETGELKLEKEEFDLALLVRDVFDTENSRAEKKGIAFTVVGDNTEPVMVYADKFRIRQVLANLTDNSINYGKQNGETRIKLSDIGEKILVEVSDNGIGIAPAHLPRIFERFYRVDKSRSRELGGTGLGLAIVKHILEAHGETVEVMSAEGAGTVFTFKLDKRLNGVKS